MITPLKQRIKSPKSYCLLYHKEAARRPAMQAIIHWLREQATMSG